MMMNKVVLVLAMAGVSVLGACSKSGGSGGGGDKLGVPECEAYLDKMSACAGKSDKTTGEQKKKMRKMMATAIADMKKQFPNCEW